MPRDEEAKLREPVREERDSNELRNLTPEEPDSERPAKTQESAVQANDIAKPAGITGNPSANAGLPKEISIGKWLKFWQGVLHVDTSKMDFGIGLRNALGVALPLAVGIAIKMPLGGLAVASGALNVSYSDGHDPYGKRATRMLGTSALCAVAVIAGGLAGHPNPTHGLNDKLGCSR